MTAAAIQQGEAPPVVLIDLSAIFHQCWHAAADQPLSVAFQATLDGVRRCINYRQGALVAVACDGKRNWRKEIDPSYKANREKREASFYDCFDRLKARLKADGLLLWEVDGFEADDIIASAVDAAIVAGHEIVICSADKDLAQLLANEGVTMLKTSTWESFDAAGVTAKFGVTPAQLGDFLAICGDKSDNIPGVPGIGAVNAAALLKKEGSIEGIRLAMETKTIDLKGKRLESLQASMERLDLSRKLVTLRYDAPINFDDIYEKREPQPLTEEIPPMPETTDADFEDTSISEAPKPTPRQAPAAPALDTKPVAQPESAPALPVESMALVTKGPPQPFELALEPQSPGQAVNLAQRLHNARLYTWLTNSDQVLAIIMRGREVGLSAGAALDIFKPIEGHICPSAHFIIDRAKKDPDCEYFQCLETTATSCTWETKNRRNPKPTKLTYTIEQARMTGLVKDDKKTSNWIARPAEMLRKTAGVQLARMEYPGAALGLLSEEEFSE